MAKKNTNNATNKAAKKSTKRGAIRKELGAFPDLSAKEIAAKLIRKGVSVSAAYVSTIKSYYQSNSRERPIDDLREAASLMSKAVELVVKAGAKEAACLVSMAARMVDKVKKEK